MAKEARSPAQLPPDPREGIPPDGQKALILLAKRFLEYLAEPKEQAQEMNHDGSSSG